MISREITLDDAIDSAENCGVVDRSVNSRFPTCSESPMHAMLFAALLAAGHPADDASHDAAVLAATIAPELQTGTLLFTAGDCLAIKASAGGPYTHVAAVVLQNGAPVVYDSMHGVGVR